VPLSAENNARYTFKAVGIAAKRVGFPATAFDKNLAAEDLSESDFAPAVFLLLSNRVRFVGLKHKCHSGYQANVRFTP
jgi:hypothetical protein